MKKILVIGSGGREHALAAKLKQSAQQPEVFCAPGNPLMVRDGIERVDIAETDIAQLVTFVKEKGIDWTIVGGETALNEGIVDTFRANDLPIIGPTKQAALLEGSKAFAKKIMQKYGVPTADSVVFDNEEAAQMYIENQTFPIVIKDNGLAAGKGVIIAQDKEMATAAISAIFAQGKSAVLIESFLEGVELSLFTIVGEETYVHAGVSRDHKRAYDNDEGPNTGGMGAYTPVPDISDEVVKKAYDQIVEPIIAGMKAEGTPFTGILYSGLMITADGLKVIEFNTRFGDPETQVLMQHMQSDLVEVLEAVLNNQEYMITWQSGYSLGVVVAANGYPVSPEKGFKLGQLTEQKEISVLGASLSGEAPNYIANGGRLFMPVTTAETLAQANRTVLSYIASLELQHVFYRSDIGE